MNIPFITLTSDFDGEPIAINVAQIATIRKPNGGPHTEIAVAVWNPEAEDLVTYGVVEPMDVVMEIISSIGEIPE